MQKRKKTKILGLLLDSTYFDDGDKSVIKLCVKAGKEKKWLLDRSFHPYLFVVSDEKNVNKTLKELEKMEFSDRETFKVFSAEKTKLKMGEKVAIKVSFNRVSHVVQARKHLKETGFERFEYNIPFGKRYLLDKRLEPGNHIKIELTGDEIKKVSKINGPFSTETVSFDLETLAGKRFSIGAEPIVMASFVDLTGKLNRVVSYKTKKIKGLELVGSEKELIKEVEKELNKVDLVVTYNGDNFDFLYLKERAKKLRMDFKINGTAPKTRGMGMDNAVKLFGTQHIDAFRIMRFLQRTGSISIVKLDIENVSEKVFGKKKEKIYPEGLNHAWKTGKGLARVVDYNRKDSQVALKIAKEFLPLFVEISKLTSQTLFDTTRSATSTMVEDLLLKEVHQKGSLAPNKPSEFEVRERMDNPIKGAFVKEPLAGLHEKIAVLDFASLYPSIIVSHNISPETLNCSHKECRKNKSPDGTWFCTKKKGLFPEVLKGLIKERLKLKAEYSKKKNLASSKFLFARQWALKIVLNSAYGYLVYPRARWYSRESGSATAAWAREYIKKSIKDAESAGFKVLYGDTDSNFLLMNDKTKKDVEKFVKKVNSSLPGDMELEIDGYYKRGLFVTRREGDAAAKKRYALVDEKGNLKIVGFEYVRRDWCKIAKETQRQVIDLVLREGKPGKAIEHVRKVIKQLKSGKVKKKDLAMITVLKRKPTQYESIGPHVSAAKKAIQRGEDIGVGSILSFIITKNGKSISEKAELEEFVQEGNYDSDYYVENQVVPAVIKIIRELGYTKEDLVHGGKQTGLNAWG